MRISWLFSNSRRLTTPGLPTWAADAHFGCLRVTNLSLHLHVSPTWMKNSPVASNFYLSLNSKSCFSMRGDRYFHSGPLPNPTLVSRALASPILSIRGILFSHYCKQQKIDSDSLVNLRHCLLIKLKLFRAVLLQFRWDVYFLFMGCLFTYLLRESGCFLDWSVLIRKVIKAPPQLTLATFWMLCIFPKQEKIKSKWGKSQARPHTLGK